ncbi:uncharacterized protein BCR38DRAFT_410519 [Pseudomassariella vexata]|uniref:Uncharacterized protein n=1 Tax=Pseudomassariella vexata TaxID=1141098 RepID=A0A1Y2DS14_9PEZI|nr:uncharacterized protein BCR38DRAFT_410519 [Pseudomassariella vexata]ORY62071.1 hypothetical protein BCR38DRAFT_410519 [Pseudomassariella vexata]
MSSFIEKLDSLLPYIHRWPSSYKGANKRALSPSKSPEAPQQKGGTSNNNNTPDNQEEEPPFQSPSSHRIHPFHNRPLSQPKNEANTKNEGNSNKEGALKTATNSKYKGRHIRWKELEPPAKTKNNTTQIAGPERRLTGCQRHLLELRRLERNGKNVSQPWKRLSPDPEGFYKLENSKWFNDNWEWDPDNLIYRPKANPQSENQENSKESTQGRARPSQQRPPQRKTQASQQKEQQVIKEAKKTKPAVPEELHPELDLSFFDRLPDTLPKQDYKTEEEEKNNDNDNNDDAEWGTIRCSVPLLIPANTPNSTSKLKFEKLRKEHYSPARNSSSETRHSRDMYCALQSESSPEPETQSKGKGKEKAMVQDKSEDQSKHNGKGKERAMAQSETKADEDTGKGKEWATVIELAPPLHVTSNDKGKGKERKTVIQLTPKPQPHQQSQQQQTPGQPQDRVKGKQRNTFINADSPPRGRPIHRIPAIRDDKERRHVPQPQSRPRVLQPAAFHPLARHAVAAPAGAQRPRPGLNLQQFRQQRHAEAQLAREQYIAHLLQAQAQAQAPPQPQFQPRVSPSQQQQQVLQQHPTINDRNSSSLPPDVEPLNRALHRQGARSRYEKKKLRDLVENAQRTRLTVYLKKLSPKEEEEAERERRREADPEEARKLEERIGIKRLVGIGANRVEHSQTRGRRWTCAMIQVQDELGDAAHDVGPATAAAVDVPLIATQEEADTDVMASNEGVERFRRVAELEITESNLDGLFKTNKLVCSKAAAGATYALVDGLTTTSLYRIYEGGACILEDATGHLISGILQTMMKSRSLFQLWYHLTFSSSENFSKISGKW